MLRSRPTCPTRISKQTSLRAVLRGPRYFGLAHALLRHNEFVDELGIRKFRNRRVWWPLVLVVRYGYFPIIIMHTLYWAWDLFIHSSTDYYQDKVSYRITVYLAAAVVIAHTFTMIDLNHFRKTLKEITMIPPYVALQYQTKLSLQ